jgi:hypothetical protein
MFHRLIGALAAASATTGCAIHPLPENVTGLNTTAIVLHIRCEARTALKHATTAFLLNPTLNFREGTLITAQKLADGTLAFADFDPSKLEPLARDSLLKYENAAIAYDFTFDIAEDNAAGGSVNFIGAVTHGTFGLGVGASSDLNRQTIRNFRVTDTFGELRRMQLCEDEVSTARNYVYPVTGSVGLDEVVMTFVDLNEFERLGNASGTSKVPVLADTFSFITTVGGSITPSVALSPVHPRFEVASASVPLTASRRDTHKLVVAMSLPPAAAAPARGRPAVGILSLSAPHLHSGRTPAEERALSEIDNQKTINSLNNIVLKSM